MKVFFIKWYEKFIKKKEPINCNSPKVISEIKSHNFLEKYIGWKGLCISTIILLIGCGIKIGYNPFDFQIFKKDNITPIFIEFFGSFFIELAIAGYLFVLLGLTFDRFQRNKQNEILELFKKNSFLALYNWIIPNNNILHTVEKQIFQSNFIRTNLSVIYTFKKIGIDIPSIILDPKRNNLIIDVEISYNIMNIKSEAKEYNIKQLINKASEPEFNRMVNCYYKKDGELKTFTEEQLNNEDLKSEADVYAMYTEYNICQIMIPSEHSAFIKTQSQVAKSTDETDFYCTKYPTEGITVIVKDLTDYILEFECVSFTFDEFTVDNKSSSTNETTWSIMTPLLPNQGYFIRWHRPRYQSAQP
jgi:hypothetical protein